jgi:hypothetical protein
MTFLSEKKKTAGSQNVSVCSKAICKVLSPCVNYRDEKENRVSEFVVKGSDKEIGPSIIQLGFKLRAVVV